MYIISIFLFVFSICILIIIQHSYLLWCIFRIGRSESFLCSSLSSWSYLIGSSSILNIISLFLSSLFKFLVIFCFFINALSSRKNSSNFPFSLNTYKDILHCLYHREEVQRLGKEYNSKVDNSIGTWSTIVNVSFFCWHILIACYSLFCTSVLLS